MGDDNRWLWFGFVSGSRWTASGSPDRLNRCTIIGGVESFLVVGFVGGGGEVVGDGEERWWTWWLLVEVGEDGG